MSVEETLLMAANGAVAAAVYSVVFYAKKREDGQDFDPAKFASTIVVGVFVGAFLSINGMDVTEENVTEMLVANVGVIALVESILKTIYRKVEEYI